MLVRLHLIICWCSSKKIQGNIVDILSKASQEAKQKKRGRSRLQRLPSYDELRPAYQCSQCARGSLGMRGHRFLCVLKTSLVHAPVFFQWPPWPKKKKNIQTSNEIHGPLHSREECFSTSTAGTDKLCPKEKNMSIKKALPGGPSGPSIWSQAILSVKVRSDTW